MDFTSSGVFAGFFGSGGCWSAWILLSNTGRQESASSFGFFSPLVVSNVGMDPSRIKPVLFRFFPVVRPDRLILYSLTESPWLLQHRDNYLVYGLIKASTRTAGLLEWTNTRIGWCVIQTHLSFTILLKDSLAFVWSRPEQKFCKLVRGNHIPKRTSEPSRHFLITGWESHAAKTAFLLVITVLFIFKQPICRKHSVDFIKGSQMFVTTSPVNWRNLSLSETTKP